MRQEELKKYAKKWSPLIIISLSVYLVFRYLLPLVSPFILAGVVSVIYYPFLRRLCKRLGIWEKKSKKWVVISAVVLFYAVVFLAVLLIGGYLFGQGEGMLLNLPFYKEKVIRFIRQCCCQMDDLLRLKSGASFTEMEDFINNFWEQASGNMLAKITSSSIEMTGKLFHGILFAIITVIATFFMINDYDYFREKMIKNEVGVCICNAISKGKDTLSAYVKAQGLIILLNGALCTLAFWFVKQPYWLFWGLLVAVVDALPIFGAGLLLIPFALYHLFMKRFGMALILFVAYIGCLTIRQFIEPKMVGSKIGMKPLYTLISMYAGFRLFGIIGFLLGPVGVLLVKEMWLALAKQ